MTLKDIVNKIEKAAKAGSITIDERIELSGELTEFCDLVNQAAEKLGNIPDKIDEPEGRQDERLAFVEGLMTQELNLNIPRSEVEGKPDAFQFDERRGLLIGGDVRLAIPFERQVRGPHKVVVDIASIGGGWDRGDYLTISAADKSVIDVRNLTPKRGTYEEVIDFKDGQSFVEVAVGCNNSGGGSGGSAEYAVIASITIIPITGG